jgi:pimeloyl-ACP methyl ester carboxylesterase
MSDCLQEIASAGIDITKYNTTENARDVRTIMTTLGYPTYNIYGISYGTKLALETMRVAPEGIRSVIIDGVAPSWVYLYNSFALKTDEVIEYVAQQCKADEACNKAYPELDKVIIDTMNKADEGKLKYKGETVPAEIVTAPFNARNGKYGSAPITRFLPAYVYELNRGKETPTVDMLLNANFDLPKPASAEVMAAAAKLPARQRNLIQALSDNAAIEEHIMRSNQTVLENLRIALEEKTVIGPVAVLFDQELEQAILAIRDTAPEKVEAIIADYVVLQNAKAAKPTLKAFVERHFVADAGLRLQALIDSMNDAEVKGSFAIVKRDSYRAEAGFLSAMYLSNYACQEDVPYNSYEGFQKVSAGLKYKQVGKEYEPLAKSFFKSCELFKPQERDYWHTPVESDIPTLSIGSLYDIQTPASWAKVAVEKLSNAQLFMIPEAGHGALLYQPCVSDMGVAFTNNPQRKLTDGCPKSIKVDFHIAPWVKANP